MSAERAQSLLSPSDVADLAGVKRPVVSNWRRRHATFPSAIAGTTAKPLFAREDVVAWLHGTGRGVEKECAGSRLWSALNVVRDHVSSLEAAELVLGLAMLRRVEPGALDRRSGEGPAARATRVLDTANACRRAHDPEGLDDPFERMARVRHHVSPLIDAVALTDIDELAAASDFALERLSRWQGRSGGELGFVGSRTSALLASLVGDEAGTVYDPASGIAAILARVHDRGVATRLVGSERNESALGIARQRARLRGAAIDFLAGDVLADDPVPDLRADVVVAEPPFGSRWDPSSKLADPRFGYGVPPRRSADLAWIQHVIAHLAPGGRGYVLTAPVTLLASGAAARRIRGNLLSAGCIEAVLTLPSKMLPHASIALSLLVLRPAGETTDVLLIDARDVDDIDTKVPAWLGVDAVRPPDDVPHVHVPVSDLLAADADLTPARHLRGATVDTDSIASTFASVTNAMQQALSSFGDAAPTFDALARLPEPRLTSVRELVDNGVIDLRAGRSGRARGSEGAAEGRSVSVGDVRRGQLPAVDGLVGIDHPDVTEAGDVLVTTIGEVRAIVDESGGLLPSMDVTRLRVIDRSVVTPGYLAAVLRGAWNDSLQRGAVTRRAPVRELEIPLIPKTDQHDVVAAQASVDRVRQHAEHVGALAREVQRTMLDALRHHVPLGPDGSGER